MNVRCLLHCEKYHCKKHSVPVIPRCVLVSAEDIRNLDLTTDVMPETRVSPRAFHLICANTCAFSRLSPSRRIQPHLPLLCLKCRRLGSSWSCSIAGSPTPSSALPPSHHAAKGVGEIGASLLPLLPLLSFALFIMFSPSPNLVKLFSAAFTITKHKEEGGRAETKREKMKPELRRARNLCRGRSNDQSPQA